MSESFGIAFKGPDVNKLNLIPYGYWMNWEAYGNEHWTGSLDPWVILPIFPVMVVDFGHINWTTCSIVLHLPMVLKIWLPGPYSQSF